MGPPLSSPPSSSPSSHRQPPDMDSAKPLQHPKVVSFRRSSEPSRDQYADIINEQSPLIRPRASNEVEVDDLYKVVSPMGSDEWQGDADEETKSSWYLFLLTLGGLGLQIGWSVETSYGSPYLLSLGVSKSMLALVWIAGPLSGVLVQPYVGMKSDRCRSPWGKRRPFIVGGAISTILSLMILAWAKEIVASVLGIFGADSESEGVKTTILIFAVLFIYVLDFAINVIQAGIRTFIVDCAPTHQQESANAWMIRISGVGNILGYLAGQIKLPDYFPWLGSTQFKILCAIASFIMAVTVAISCSTISERDPRFDPILEEQEGIFAFFKSLGHSVRRLPPQIRKVCEVQFLAWIGWFPFLFYITTYVGQIYMEPTLEKNPNLSESQLNQLLEEATIIGTRALFLFAIVTFTASVFLPFVIPPTYEAPKAQPHTPMTPMTPATPGSIGGGGGGYFALRPSPEKPSSTTVAGQLSRSLKVLQINSLTLRRAWILSHIIFVVLMAATFFVRTTLTATILVALIGVPWTLTNWAPFALISSELSKRDAIRRGLLRPSTREAANLVAGEDDSEGADQAGVVLGIHNVAIAAPQVIATLVSSIIFKMLQKPRGAPGDNSVAWVLRFGGICAVVAAWLTTRVTEEKADASLPSMRRRRS